MASPAKVALALVVLQCCHSTRSEASLEFHPGHPPHHVTRLHRYEHMGLQSMLEEEARWTEDMQKSSTSGKVLKDIHHIRGSSMLEEGAQLSEYSGFVKLSDVQSKALQEHHESWIAWLQMQDGGEEVLSETSSNHGGGKTPNAALLQRFKSYLSAYRQNHTADEVGITRLSSLSSQYVGPVGVGTRVEPPGCVINEGATPVETNASLFDKIGGFFSTLPSKLANVSAKVASSFGQTCTIEDQSKVWVVYDTGSTNIWIASDLCKSGACRLPGRHMFNHSASATFAYPDSMLQLTVQFGTGKITGPQAVDDFHIGPFTVYNQTFAMIETESGSVFNDVPFEGIVGLAFDKMSANHVRPFFSSIIQQKAMQHNEFAFYFSKDKPTANALMWGGVDKKFYEGKLEYFPVIDPYYWSLKLHNFKIGNDVILGEADTYDGGSSLLQKGDGASRRKDSGRTWNGAVAIVDTGTTFFTAEGHKFGQVMKKLPPGNCKDITEETHPPITITLENTLGNAHDFVLTNKQYMTQSGKGGSHCSPAFMQIDLPKEHGPGMVLGEIFLRHYFSVFDRDSGNEADAKVAFAKSSNKPDAMARLQELTADQPTFADSAAAAKVAKHS